MIDGPGRTSVRNLARLAGGIYLFHFGMVFLFFYFRMGLVVAGDAASTAANIQGHEVAYRLSLTASVMAVVSYTAVTALLYVLLKPASKILSLLAAAFGLAGCVVGALLSANLLVPLVLLTNGADLASFTPGQLQTAALISLRLGGIANSVAMVFFGGYCLLLGCLVLNSTFLPRLVGALLLLSGTVWLVSSFATFLAPDLVTGSALYFMPIGAFGELALALWLSVIGLNAQKWLEADKALKGQPFAKATSGIQIRGECNV